MGVTQRDLLFNLLMLFMFLLFIIVPFIAEEQTKKDERLGEVIVEMHWDSESDSDLDLWVMGPDNWPVGYSNKNGPLMNLVRDDLGKRADVSGINLENSISTGFIPGRFVVNVQAYRIHDRVMPVKGRMIVMVKADEKSSAKQILYSDFVISREGEELTIFQFTLDDKRKLVKGSVNTAQVKIRGGYKP